ncbi:hypothetical protein V8E52_005800 [Russula decolorans]|jgi:hypothetical protein
MVFWDDFGDFFPSLLLRYKLQSFQLIHHHYQRGPIWSAPSEATESATDPLSSRQLAAILQRQFHEEDHLLVAERAELLAAAEQHRVFDCGVCLDTLPEESIPRIDPLRTLVL